VLSVFLALGLWAILSWTGVISANALPGPWPVARTLLKDLGTVDLWSGIWATSWAWAAGLAAALMVAVPLGALIGLSRTTYRVARLTIEFLRTIPIVAALPVLVIVYGVGQQLTILLVALTAVWPLLIQVTYGFRDIDPVIKETAKVYGFSRTRRFFRVLLPVTLPSLATALKLSGLIGLAAAIATSLVVGGPGLGNVIAVASDNDQVASMYAAIVIGGIMGLLVSGGLTIVEHQLLRWHTSHRPVQV
jgi:ABC-type nitrate/sulfonate/bicarbonate transport system permease component